MYTQKKIQPPKGYRLASTFQYPMVFIYINKFSLLLIPFGLYLLASWSIISGIFQDLAELGSNSVTMLILAIIMLSTDLVRGLIQRGISRWLGYTISFDDRAFPFMLRTYTAAPGQFQTRRDVLLIAVAPLGVFLLLWLPLLFGLSGTIAGFLLFFLIANILGTIWDFYLIVYLLRRSAAMLLYTESSQNILIFEQILK